VLVLLFKVCISVYRTHGFNCGFDLYLGSVVFNTEIQRELKTFFFILMAIIQEVKLIYIHQVVIQLYFRKVLYM